MFAVFKLRFSLRALLAFQTFVCLFFGGWELTKDNAIDDVTSRTGQAGDAVAPFVVQTDLSDNFRVHRQYHLWCFGVVLRLPFDRNFPEPNPVILGGVRPRIIIQPDELESTIGGSPNSR